MERKNKYFSRKFIVTGVAFLYAVLATQGLEIPLKEVVLVDGILMAWVLIEGIIDMFKKG